MYSEQDYQADIPILCSVQSTKGHYKVIGGCMRIINGEAQKQTDAFECCRGCEFSNSSQRLMRAIVWSSRLSICRHRKYKM